MLDTMPIQTMHDKALARRDHHVQCAPERALACHGTRQSSASPGRSRPPLQAYLCITLHRTTSTLLDTLNSSRRTHRRRHDRTLAATVLQALERRLHASVHNSPCHHAH